MFKYFLVFLGAAIPGLEIMLAIPVGIVSGLAPLWVIIIGFMGNLLTVLAVIFGFEKIKGWWEFTRKKDQTKKSKRTERGKKILEKYGMPGLALLGPIFIGTHIAVFLGLLFGAKKSYTIIWIIISMALWSLVFGIVTAMGFDFFSKRF